MGKIQGKLVELDRESVNMVFQNAQNQGEYIIGLYKLVYPDWDDIVKVNGFPKVSDTDNHHIMVQAIAFDKREHPDVISGGGWMNNGFSSYASDGIADGTCMQADYTLAEDVTE